MHGFYRDGKARFGRIFPPCRPRLELPVVPDEELGNRKDPLSVAFLEEDQGEEGRSANFGASGNPVSRSAAAVRDRQNPNRLAPDNVGNVIRKDSQIDAPVAARAQAIEFRMVGNPQNAPVHFVFETSSQAIAGFFVLGN